MELGQVCRKIARSSPDSHGSLSRTVIPELSKTNRVSGVNAEKRHCSFILMGTSKLFRISYLKSEICSYLIKVLRGSHRMTIH